MKLIASLTSPFARKVRVVLAEKRIDCELVVDIPWTAETKVPDFNPLGKIPVLVMDDGNTLYDSRVIVDYLDTLTPVARLIPDDTRQRIQVKRWEALADGLCDAAALIFLEKKRPEAAQSQDWIIRQEKKVVAALQAMARDLGEKRWCTGESYSLADVALGCALGYVDFRFPKMQWRDAHPSLAKHWDRLKERPSFADTIPVA